MNEFHEFRVLQGGLDVAGAAAPDRDRAVSMAMAYADQYAEDGHVEVQERINGRWKAILDSKWFEGVE